MAENTTGNGSEYILGERADEELARESQLTKKELRDRRLAAYDLWQESLDEQVNAGQISLEERRRLVSRALLARDLVADRNFGAANIDPLTQLPNRRAFNTRYNEMTRNEAPFGLLLLDIDHFKQFNDTWGHEVGDIVLVQTGLRIASSIRQVELQRPGGVYKERHDGDEDMAARLGGEEMAVLLTGINNEEDLFNKAEQIRKLITETPYSFMSKGQRVNVPVTTSIGAGLYYPGQDRKDFITRVDKVALYGAKEQGRNRSIILPR